MASRRPPLRRAHHCVVAATASAPPRPSAVRIRVLLCLALAATSPFLSLQLAPARAASDGKGGGGGSGSGNRLGVRIDSASLTPVALNPLAGHPRMPADFGSPHPSPFAPFYPDEARAACRWAAPCPRLEQCAGDRGEPTVGVSACWLHDAAAFPPSPESAAGGGGGVGTDRGKIGAPAADTPLWRRPRFNFGPHRPWLGPCWEDDEGSRPRGGVGSSGSAAPSSLPWGAPGQVLRPWCYWGGDRRLGLRRRRRGNVAKQEHRKPWRVGWVAQVTVLRNVYVDWKGQVFNRTHLFDVEGCHARDEFRFDSRTKVRRLASAVNLLDLRGDSVSMPSPPSAAQEDYGEGDDDNDDKDDEGEKGISASPSVGFFQKVLDGLGRQEGAGGADGHSQWHQQWRENLNSYLDMLTYHLSTAIMALSAAQEQGLDNTVVMMHGRQHLMLRFLKLAPQLFGQFYRGGKGRPGQSADCQGNGDTVCWVKAFASMLRRSSAPVEEEVWFVERLVQPLFQSCEGSSSGLWRSLRSFMPWAPLASPPGTLLESAVERLVEYPGPQLTFLGEEWVVVVDKRVFASVDGRTADSLRACLTRLFAKQRVVVTSGRLDRDRELLSRAVLYVVSARAGSLAAMMFMPPAAAVIELHPSTTAAVDSVPSASSAAAGAAGAASAMVGPLEGVPRLAEQELAEAMELQLFVVFCAVAGEDSSVGRAMGTQGGSSVRKKALRCEWDVLLDTVDRAARYVYPVLDAAVRESLARGPSAAGEAGSGGSRGDGVSGRGAVGGNSGGLLQQVLSQATPTRGGADAPLPLWKQVVASPQFARWQRCVAERGRWVMNPTPRRLPWEYNWFTLHQACDQVHITSVPGGVAGDSANEIADRFVKEFGPLGTAGGSEAVAASILGSVAATALAATWKVRDTLKYEWRVDDSNAGSCPALPLRQAAKGAPPSAHVLEQMDAAAFCERVGRGKTILFLGDSLQEEMATAFLNAMAATTRGRLPEGQKAFVNDGPDDEELVAATSTDKENMLTDAWDMRAHPLVCPGLRAIYMRKYFLWGEYKGVRWTHLRQMTEADIFVVNQGAHFKETVDYMMGIRNFFSYMRRRFPDKLIVFRDTPPGHVGCIGARQPSQAPEDDSVLRQREKFHWWEFSSQGALVKELTEELGYVFMDVSTMTKLRPDGHISSYGNMSKTGKPDCLHYCVPGPVDGWIQMLYNTLMWVSPVGRGR